MNAAFLDHVALVFADAQETAERIGAILGLEVTTRATPWSSAHPALHTGRTWLEFLRRDEVEAADGTVEGMDHLGLASENPRDMLAYWREQGLVARDDDRSMQPETATRFFDLSGTMGMRIQLVERVDEPPALTPSDSYIERVDHIGVASSDNEEAKSIFSDRLGFPIESSQLDSEARIALESFVSDKYDVVYHTRPAEALAALRVLFITVGDCELEFLQDVAIGQPEPEGRDRQGSTKQDQTAIARFIARRGAGLHHIAFKVRDIEKALALAQSNGAVLIDHKPRPGSRRSEIAFLHPSSTGGVLLHFVERQAE